MEGLTTPSHDNHRAPLSLAHTHARATFFYSGIRSGRVEGAAGWHEQVGNNSWTPLSAAQYSLQARPGTRVGAHAGARTGARAGTCGRTRGMPGRRLVESRSFFLRTPFCHPAAPSTLPDRIPL